MRIDNYLDSPNVEVADHKGIFRSIRYLRDLSVANEEAMTKFYQAQMEVNPRQLYIELSGSTSVHIIPGAMQMSLGDIKMTTGVKGVGDFIGKKFTAMTTGASVIHPLYTGSGVIITEPTYNHKIIVNIGESKEGLVIRDGMLYAYESTIDIRPVPIESVSGALFGGKGLFNLGLKGAGYAVLESPLPMSEIVKVTLSGNQEELRVDGPFAVMWDKSLRHTVERSSKSFIGSAVSGEGLVNVYRGSGSVWLELTAYTRAQI